MEALVREMGSLCGVPGAVSITRHMSEEESSGMHEVWHALHTGRCPQKRRQRCCTGLIIPLSNQGCLALSSPMFREHGILSCFAARVAPGLPSFFAC